MLRIFCFVDSSSLQIDEKILCEIQVLVNLREDLKEIRINLRNVAFFD